MDKPQGAGRSLPQPESARLRPRTLRRAAGSPFRQGPRRRARRLSKSRFGRNRAKRRGPLFRVPRRPERRCRGRGGRGARGVRPRSFGRRQAGPSAGGRLGARSPRQAPQSPLVRRPAPTRLPRGARDRQPHGSFVRLVGHHRPNGRLGVRRGGGPVHRRPRDAPTPRGAKPRRIGPPGRKALGGGGPRLLDARRGDGRRARRGFVRD